MVQNTIIGERYSVSIPGVIDSLDAFRDWYTSEESPELGKCYFIQGEFYVDMSPEYADSHVLLKSVIYATVGRLVADADTGLFFADRLLVTNTTANVSNEPDACFVSWQTLESGRASKVQNPERGGDYLEVTGSVDWVCEVVSASSIRKDTVQLKQAYFDAGVTEYWLIDGRGEDLSFQLLRRGEAGYEPTPSDAEGYAASTVFGRRFKLTRERDRVGGWKYRLHTEPA